MAPCELQNFAVALQRISGSQTPFLLDAAAMAGVHGLDWKQLDPGHLASTQPVTGHTPRFVDKLPHNFLHVGFIAHALPRAWISCLRRDPVDSCLNNFSKKFDLLFDQESPNSRYPPDLLDTGRYCLRFDRVMALWQRAFRR